MKKSLLMILFNFAAFIYSLNSQIIQEDFEGANSSCDIHENQVFNGVFQDVLSHDRLALVVGDPAICPYYFEWGCDPISDYNMGSGFQLAPINGDYSLFLTDSRIIKQSNSEENVTGSNGLVFQITDSTNPLPAFSRFQVQFEFQTYNFGCSGPNFPASASYELGYSNNHINNNTENFSGDFYLGEECQFTQIPYCSSFNCDDIESSVSGTTISRLVQLDDFADMTQLVLRSVEGIANQNELIDDILIECTSTCPIMYLEFEKLTTSDIPNFDCTVNYIGKIVMDQLCSNLDLASIPYTFRITGNNGYSENIDGIGEYFYIDIPDYVTEVDYHLDFGDEFCFFAVTNTSKSNIGIDHSPTLISSNETYFDPVFTNDVHVKAGGELIIQGDAYFSSDVSLYVEQGGRLIIDNGALLTSCSSNWEGIVLEGNSSSQPSNPYAPLQADDAGVIIMKPNSVVENAVTGISCLDHDDFYGGLIYAENGSNFLNCGTGVDFMPMKEDRSTFNGVTFNCKEYGVTSRDNHGVTFSGCTFTGMSKSGIYLEDATVNVYDNCLFEDNLYGIYADYSYTPEVGSNKIGKDSGPGNTFRDNGADLIFRGAAHTNTIYDNQFWNSSDAIYMDGMNRYTIEGNQFFNIDRRANVMFSTGNAISNIEENEYSSTRQGILLYGENDQTEFDVNCFYNTDEADVFLASADIDDEIGTLGASAANCFSSSGAFNIYTAGMIEPFTYWEPELINCQVPTDLGQQFRQEASDATINNCDGSSGFTGGESEVCAFDLGVTNMDSMLLAIEQEITTIELDTTLTFQEEVNLKKAKYCLSKVLTAYVDSLLTEGNCEKAFALYNRQADDALRLKAYSVLMDCDNCEAASQWLSQYHTQNAVLQDYVAVQQINVQRICNPREFETTQEVLYTLYPLTQETHPYGAYARSVLHILTGESIFLPLPEIDREVNPRSVEDSLSEWSIHPNPTSDQLTVIFDRFLSKGELMITDNLGRCVHHLTITEEDFKMIDVSDYDTGIYYLRVSGGDKVLHIDRFIVK